ncbi:SpoIID/LytB domain-containing protein [Chlamydia vaughanii]|uniref:SpoIID/LytB domain-containing protein n=1 Tax=Chlamydia vaughanii TaxID=3112552 RepID=UPI0039F56322
MVGVGHAEVKVSDTFMVQPVVSEPKIRVLLLEESTTALIEAKGAYRLYGDNVLLQSTAQGLRCAAHALYGGVRWGENFPGIQCLKIEPADNSASLFVNGLQYKGALYIHKTDKNCIVITNELTIEEYLKSILSTKYLRELDKEALSACVILERTALYERLLAKNPQNFWHVVASEDNYTGYGATKQFYGVEDAVDWTSRLIVDNPAGLIIDADGLLKANVDRLAVEGYNARQILEQFYKDADFVVIESWSDEANEMS